MFALASGLSVLWAAPPACDALRGDEPGSRGARVCSFRARTGYPCLGCGGTTALALTARGDFRRAMAANPLGAFVGLAAWATVVGAGLSMSTARGGFLKAALLFAVVSLPLAFLVNAVYWWISLPASVRL